MILFKVRCPYEHGAWTYHSGDNWFNEDKSVPQIACTHCGISCIVKRGKDLLL